MEMKKHNVNEALILIGPPESRALQRKFGILHYRPFPGSDKRPCSRCSRKTWLGPKQLTYLNTNPNTPVYCFTCAKEEMTEFSFLQSLGPQGGSYWMIDDERNL
jgi:hypothetical protein